MSQHTRSPSTTAAQVTTISRTDRWQIYHRLQELRIPAWCPEDGSLWVEVDDAISAFLVRSTVQQFAASRRELLDWLERCWTLRV
ncbi:hypothetical protein H6F89_11140 [Cyanobacteria bacterium FACHB-63]|nr:hypothetical protein [Cyanobacteria bacterium FACHB-63]